MPLPSLDMNSPEEFLKFLKQLLSDNPDADIVASANYLDEEDGLVVTLHNGVHFVLTADVYSDETY